jgi:hypothetical protein
MSTLLSPTLLQRWAGRPGKLILVTLSTFMFGFLFQLVWTVPGHAQNLPDQCLEPLPTPTPTPPSHRVVQLVNCTNFTVLGAANAAGPSPDNLFPVLPREGTWVMGPLGSNRNVLTIDIPVEWEDTQKGGSSGPRFWARTGCRYEIASDRAQCETGDCGGKYDCSKAKLAGSPPTTVSEWIFYQPFPNNKFQDHFDISVVDGFNLNMDIQQVGGSPTDPVNPGSAFWLVENSPLTKYGQDLRNQCLASFTLKRSDLMGTPTGKGFPTFGYVIMGDNGQPVGGDNTVACFSNCGRYEYPATPGFNCDPTDHTSRCFLWKVFCTVQLPPPATPVYGGKCNTDADCAAAQLSACWDLHDPKSPLNKTCQPRAFIKNQTCPPDVCTFAYGFLNPKTGNPDFSSQPPAGHCADVNDNLDDCIGDDTVHQVMPKGLTWPNDPEVFGGDAPLYRVIFAPGNTLVPITDSTAGFPLCSTLSEVQYEYSKWGLPAGLCSVPINQGAIFAVAHLRTANPPNWTCDLQPGDSGATGPICRWKQGPVFIPAPPPSPRH